MPIIKGSYVRDFTTIPNSTLQDNRLSFDARGVLILMLSMPSDWEMYKGWLCDQCPNTGRDKMTRILKELEAYGYLVRNKKRTNGGKFDSYEWYVYPSPKTDLPLTAKPDAGESATTKETDIQNKQETKLLTNPDELANKVIDLWNEIKHKAGVNWQAVDNKNGRTVKRIRDTNNRIKMARSRLEDKTDESVLRWFHDFFAALSKNKFYSGAPSQNKPGGYRWDYGQIMREDTFVKAIERLNEGWDL